MSRTGAMRIAITCMLKALMNPQGASLQELAEETGLNTTTLSHYIKSFARHKLVYIHSWEKDTRNCHSIRRWKLGTRPDAPKPANYKLTQFEQRKRWREQKQAQKTQVPIKHLTSIWTQT